MFGVLTVLTYVCLCMCVCVCVSSHDYIHQSLQSGRKSQCFLLLSITIGCLRLRSDCNITSIEWVVGKFVVKSSPTFINCHIDNISWGNIC